jgi:ubiquinone/menaquinone biosynthesis C-methylase UbiE
VPSRLWSECLGRAATRRLKRWIVPHLRWNQEIWGETILQHLSQHSPARPMRWLDAGCGWRLLSKDLEALEDELVRRAGLAVGVDLDFAHLRKHLDITRRACASLNALPFPDNSFDLITCNMVLEHLPEPLPVFQEMARVLVPGGRIMVHTPNTRNYLVLSNLVAKAILPRSLILKLIRDDRAVEDIYPTFYRANNRRALHELGERVHLQPEFLRGLTQPQPYWRFFAPLAFLELLLMRLTLTAPFDRFGATIIMSFQKSAQLKVSTPEASAETLLA